MNSNSSLLSLEPFCSGFGWKHWDIVPPFVSGVTTKQPECIVLYFEALLGHSNQGHLKPGVVLWGFKDESLI